MHSHSASKLITTISLGFVFTLAGCVPLKIDKPAPVVDAAGDWQQPQQKADVDSQWLTSLQDPALVKTVQSAMKVNFTIQTALAQLEQSRQQLIINKAPLLPALDLGSSLSRSESSGVVADSASIQLSLSYQLDLWGALSDSAKQANFDYAARQADLKRAQQQLAADIAAGWFRLIEAQQLEALYQQRLDNLTYNLQTIEYGYNQGLNESLDIYLARNDVQQEQARLSDQQQTRIEAARTLELLLADYPDGLTALSSSLPSIDTVINAGVPSQLISRRADLQSSWLTLMSANAVLAIAHKQRFPSITLQPSASLSGDSVASALGSSVGWSLLGQLSAPIFNAGRLEALEKQSLARQQELEKLYLEKVFDAFAEVENALNKQQALQHQYNAYQKAQSNADTAYQLAFEQYQKGLVNYITVLSAQRRLFDSQTSVIQLKGQLLQNRIALYLALGGDYLANMDTTESKDSA